MPLGDCSPQATPSPSYDECVRATLLVGLVGCGFQVAGSQPRDAVAGGDGPAIDSPTVLSDTPIDMMVDAPMAVDLIIEAETANPITMPSTYTWTPRTATAGFSGASYMELLGGNGAACPSLAQPTLPGCAATMFYDVTVQQAATYTFWVRMWADTNFTDSVYVTVDDMAAATAQQVDVIEDASWRWSKSLATSTYTLAAGVHRLGIWHREAGVRVDKLALMTGANPPP